MKPATTFIAEQFPITTKNPEIKAFAEKLLKDQLIPVPEIIPKPAGESFGFPMYKGNICFSYISL